MNPQYLKRTLWPHPAEPGTIQVLDQRLLPHQVIIENIRSSNDATRAITDMIVRGAPLIGAMAAYGVYFACMEAIKAARPEEYFEKAVAALRHSRPTAINLAWAVDRQLEAISGAVSYGEKAVIALNGASLIVEEDVERCRLIGTFGLPLLENLHQLHAGRAVQILTHCNAGRLGCIEWGTITAPIYLAQQQGMDVHVWVDETRPRNQGSALTAWELQQAGIPHTIIVDNAGGHLMQHGMVDIVIVGADRVTRRGDVANKIGTYLKALAAHHNQVPFYVALPSTSIDWEISDGLLEIPIEERSAAEVKYISGWDGNKVQQVLLTPVESNARNFGFDVTPAELITGFITEKGICGSTEQQLRELLLPGSVPAAAIS